MNTITIDDSGGNGANRFKIVVSGNTEPEKSSANGATNDQSDSIYPTDDGYAIQGQPNGGRDAYHYNDARTRMVLEHSDVSNSRSTIWIGDPRTSSTSASEATGPT